MGLVYRNDWADVPHTNEHAMPVEFEDVQNMDVVHVDKITIREAVVENHCFEIANTSTVGDLYQGKPRVEVRCLWYGRKPITTWMHLTLLGTCKVFTGYTGTVVRNIGPPVDRQGADKNIDYIKDYTGTVVRTIRV